MHKASAQTSFFDVMAGGEEKVSDTELVDTPPFSPVEDLKNERNLLGVYISGHPLQSCRRIISEVSTFKAADFSNVEKVDEMLRAIPDSKHDKWKLRRDPHLKDKLMLTHLDVRIVGSLSSCSVRAGKPRPDGMTGGKWAILGIDDGTGTLEGMCFAKAWETCAGLETKIDQLVMLCGEVSHRVNYDKADVERKHPSLGDLSFTIKEAYPIETAMPILSDGMRLRITHAQDTMAKVEKIRAIAAAHIGSFPLIIDIAMENGAIVSIGFGPTCRVTLDVTFLAEIAKILPQSDTSFHPSDKIYLAPPTPKPWEM